MAKLIGGECSKATPTLSEVVNLRHRRNVLYTQPFNLNYRPSVTVPSGPLHAYREQAWMCSVVR